jgi:L-lysine 6-transaminase
VKSRISSTFGGNLVDFVRCARYLEILRDEDLLANVRSQGAFLLDGIQALVDSTPGLGAPRGRGLLIAFDAPDTTVRDRIVERAHDEGLLVLACGDRSVRLRPALDLSRADAEEGLSRLGRAVRGALS